MDTTTGWFIAIGVVLVVIAIGLTIDIKLNWMKRHEQRGFEMKLNAGEEPVTEKKENDHG